MTRPLRRDALEIWQAGVDAVRPARLIPEHLAVDQNTLVLGDHEIPLAEIRRIVVVGCGKAGAGMVQAVENTLGRDLLQAKEVTGLVNVPADCVVETEAVELVAARPAGQNEPTPQGVAATQRMVALVGSLRPEDLCLCLISGGGSALLELPIDGFALADLVELTRDLSAAGATIEQLNAVRRALSQVKGGGLARATRAGRLVSLILSDVLGDDLRTIASGPTVLAEPDLSRAAETLRELNVADTSAGRRALAILQQPRPTSSQDRAASTRDAAACEVTNLLIGNNAAAVDAAGVAAERLGYNHAMHVAAPPEGEAEQIASELARLARQMRDRPGPNCLISGGEPTVRLAPAEERGLGGRNQQLALAALNVIDDWRSIALLSGGTDGEDGPTDAAGAVVDLEIARRAVELGLDPADYLRRNDAYRFFEQTGGLIQTGPTHTNVCDLRVVAVDREGT